MPEPYVPVGDGWLVPFGCTIPFGFVPLNVGSGVVEHGRSLTATVNWQPKDWLRLTAEIVAVDSTSRARAAAGLSARAIDVEPQLGAKLSF